MVEQRVLCRQMIVVLCQRVPRKPGESVQLKNKLAQVFKKDSSYFNETMLAEKLVISVRERIVFRTEGFDDFESFLIRMNCARYSKKGGLGRQLFITSENLNSFSLNT